MIERRLLGTSATSTIGYAPLMLGRPTCALLLLVAACDSGSHVAGYHPDSGSVDSGTDATAPPPRDAAVHDAGGDDAGYGGDVPPPRCGNGVDCAGMFASSCVTTPPAATRLTTTGWLATFNGTELGVAAADDLYSTTIHVFDLDATGQATQLRLGSEVDMGSPSAPPPMPRP